MLDFLLSALVEILVPIVALPFLWLGEAILWLATGGRRGFQWRPFGRLSSVFCYEEFLLQDDGWGLRRLLSILVGVLVVALAAWGLA